MNIKKRLTEVGLGQIIYETELRNIQTVRLGTVSSFRRKFRRDNGNHKNRGGNRRLSRFVFLGTFTFKKR